MEYDTVRDLCRKCPFDNSCFAGKVYVREDKEPIVYNHTINDFAFYIRQRDKSFITPCRNCWDMKQEINRATSIVTIYILCSFGSHRQPWRTGSHEEIYRKEITFPSHATKVLYELSITAMAGLSRRVGHVHYDPLNFRHKCNDTDTSQLYNT